jgi:hypothetical protein
MLIELFLLIMDVAETANYDGIVFLVYCCNVSPKSKHTYHFPLNHPKSVSLSAVSLTNTVFWDVKT